MATDNDDDDDAGTTRDDVKRLAASVPSSALFHDQDHTGFADFVVSDHRETWPIRSQRFQYWLRQKFFSTTGRAPSDAAVATAIKTIEARAIYEGPVHPVHVRVASMQGRLYLDLGDEAWRAIEVDASGWRILTSPPVRFRRAPGMRPLPIPLAGGRIEDLRPFLNVSDDGFVLVVAYLLACLLDRGPYPVLVLVGEPGTSKSTTTRILRALVDPNSTPLRTPPSTDRDFFIAIICQHLVALDNMSTLRPWLSDALCQVATGAGFAARRLRTDTDEVRFSGSRPIILNGISTPATRSDLVDRALVLPLARITDERRRTEQELLDAFADASPRILGALLDGVARGLELQSRTKLENKPRMADFAHWASACETAFWPAGTFMSAYRRNSGEAMQDALEADPIAFAVLALMERRAVWSGTATELLRDLGHVAVSMRPKPKMPNGAHMLSTALSRAAPLLLNAGLQIASSRVGHSRTRIIRISRADQKSTKASAPSAASAETADCADGDRLLATAQAKVADPPTLIQDVVQT
jgi:hypothetical protein